MELKKLLIPALIISVAISSSMLIPIKATAKPTAIAFASTVDTTSTVSQNYSVSIENAIYNVQNNINDITAMQSSEVVTNSVLLDFATKLFELYDSVVASNAYSSSDVISVVTNASSVLCSVAKTDENTTGLGSAKAALTALQVILGLPNTVDYSDGNTNGNPTTVTPTPINSPVIEQENNGDGELTVKEQEYYRDIELTVNDLKSWDWDNGGTIQIGGQYCNFGKSKSNGLLWIEAIAVKKYYESDADIIVSKLQWESLPSFKYGKFKYKTYFYGCLMKRINKVTLKYSDKDRTIAQEGDTFIDKKGKRTKLTALKYKNKEREGDYVIVVGYGQKLDLFSGMKYGDGVFKPGDTGTTWYGDDHYKGDTYLVASNGEGHFAYDWYIIESYEKMLTKKVKNPKNGQKCGYWMQYSAKNKKWVWIGPKY